MVRTKPIVPVVKSSQNHNELKNLDYSESKHTGFQKELVWDEKLKCYLVEKKEGG